MKKIKTGYCGLLMIFFSVLGAFALSQKDYPLIIGIFFLAISAICLVLMIMGLIKEQ